MDEQEIVAVLREHVARSQNAGSSGGGTSHGEPSRVDVPKLDYLSVELWRLGSGVGQLNPRNAGFLNRAVQAFKKFIQRSLSWYTRSLQNYHHAVNQTLEFHARSIAVLQEQILQEGGGLPEFLQDTLRSERRATQEQQAPYADLFRGLQPVLDLGCGRGEFLEVLDAKGISAYGIDSDPLACEEVRRKSLTVIEGDLFDTLEQVPLRSLGGIFCSRVLEYLPSHLQADLIASAAAKLKPGGLLVIETLNPGSDTPFGRNSHIDPTHLRAIYPEVLKSLVESTGLEGKICVLAPQEVFVGGSDERHIPSKSQTYSCDLVSSKSMLRAPSYAVLATRR